MRKARILQGSRERKDRLRVERCPAWAQLAPWQSQCPWVYVKMEAICFCEISGDLHWTTQRYIPKDFRATAARTSGLKELICFMSLQSHLGPSHEDGNSSHPAWHNQHSRWQRSQHQFSGTPVFLDSQHTCSSHSPRRSQISAPLREPVEERHSYREQKNNYQTVTIR